MSSPSNGGSASDREECREIHWRAFDGEEEFGGGVMVRKRGMLLDGKKEGLWIQYKADGKTIRDVTSYQADKIHGNRILFSGGVVDCYQQWQSGVKHGVEVLYLSNGNIQVEHFKNGASEGVYLLYFGDGHLKERGSMLNGARHGLWEMWGTDGRLSARGYYGHGKKIGGW